MAIDDIRLLVLDVDGVLTDGGIYVSDTGLETKRFHVRDGLAIKVAQHAGLAVGIISGRSTRAVTLRMTELGIDLLIQGCRDKAEGLRQLCDTAGIATSQCAYMGDDLIDLPALRTCGYPITVADGVAEAQALARYITIRRGGQGAVREAVEHLLKAQGKWDAVVARFEHD